MISISVIVPFYNGNRYLNVLKTYLEEACKNYSQKVEVVIVNDSPDIDIDIRKIKSCYYDLALVKHSYNQGIHQARVTGMKKARGMYILFLDQDDKVSKDFFKEMATALDRDKEAQFVFCNGIFQNEKGQKLLIINSYGKVLAVQNYKTYFKVGNLLASPGQCLIRKCRIPSVWMTNIMQTNCSDDLMLWLLMLKEGKAIYVNKLLYEHISTGENVSSNRLNAYLSDIELCTILEKVNIFPPNRIYRFKCKCINKCNREKKQKFNHFKFYIDLCIEYITRMNMKIMGALYFIAGKKICEY